MADLKLFELDDAGRWQLAHDRLQWIIQRRAGTPRTRHLDGYAIVDSGWRGVAFIGSTKAVLWRALGERGVVVTPAAQARLDAMPDKFVDFIAAPVDIAAAA